MNIECIHVQVPMSAYLTMVHKSKSVQAEPFNYNSDATINDIN